MPPLTVPGAASRVAEMRTGGQVLADGLVAHGSELAFCVPGESYLALLDGLYEHREAFRIVNCRHEGAAANAADAYGKLTGRPGLCFVTRGPGATHAAAGIHTAQQDSTPLLMLVGQVSRNERGRESFQELDYEAVFGPMAKWAFEIDDPERIPEVLARAYTVATSGRPGPVVLALPEDVLSAEVDVPDAPRYRAVRPAPSPEAIEELGALLEAAERPFVLVGGGPWDDDSAQAFTRWALACGLPVGATFRRQDVVDNTCPSYAGDVGIGLNPALAQRIRDCDLLVAVGTRLTEIETQGYTLPAPPVAPQPLVHVHPDPAELGRVYQPSLAVLSGVAEFAAAAPLVDGARWAEWTAAARADYEAWIRARRGARRRRRHGRGGRLPARRARRRRRAHQRRGQLLRLGRALLPVAALRHAARAAERRDGLRRAGGAGGEARAPRARGRRVRGRRRLPDVRDGARHRGPGGAADPRDRRQQRHLRDDPHAPGAALPRARDRHRPRQPRLRRPRARLRRPRRADRARRRVPGRLAARADMRRAGADRADHGSGSPDAERFADARSAADEVRDRDRGARQRRRARPRRRDRGGARADRRRRGPQRDHGHERRARDRAGARRACAAGSPACRCWSRT